jgi:hypothetical protein
MRYLGASSVRLPSPFHPGEPIPPFPHLHGRMASVRNRPPAGTRQSPGRARPARTRHASQPGAVDGLLAALRRRPRTVVAALVLLHLVLAGLAFMPAPQPGGDNAVYLSLARSLLDGGYRDLFDPATPVHTQFPPGFPAIVAAALALGLTPWVGIKLVIVAFSAAGVALTYGWIRRRRRPDLALGVALLVAVSPGVLALSHWELSDVPFWAMTTGALLAWERLPRRRNGRAAVAALLTACAYLTRSAGLPLLLAAAAFLAWRRRWTQLGIYAAVVVPAVLAWALRPGQGGYASLIRMSDVYALDRGTVSATGLLDRAWENAALYGGRFMPTLLGGGASALLAMISVAVVALAVYGWARRMRRPGVAELWVPLYVAMLLVWNPEWAGDRLLLPLFPALLMYAGDALARLARMRVLPRPAPALGAALLAVTALPGVAEGTRMGTFCTAEYRRGDRLPCLEPNWRDFFQVAEEAGRTLPERSAVLSRKPALFWSASGLPGRTYPLSREPDSLFRAAREAGARYVLLDDLDQVATGYLTPVLMRRPAAFCIVRSLGADRATLLGIRPDAERIPDLRGDPGEAAAQVGFKPCGPEYLRPGVQP